MSVPYFIETLALGGTNFVTMPRLIPSLVQKSLIRQTKDRIWPVPGPQSSLTIMCSISGGVEPGEEARRGEEAAGRLPAQTRD